MNMIRVRSRGATGPAPTSQMAATKYIALGAVFWLCAVLVIVSGPARAVDGTAARSAVTSVEVPAASNVSTRSAARLGSQGRAPSWPFAGAISFYGASYPILGSSEHRDIPDPEHGSRYGVRFASAFDGNYSDVDFGIRDGDICRGDLSADVRGVYLSYWGRASFYRDIWGNGALVWIPWGDLPYPILSPVRINDSRFNSETNLSKTTIDAKTYSNEWSFVDIEEERFYYRSQFELSGDEASYERFVFDHDPESESIDAWNLDPLIFSSGWDGSVYGIRSEAGYKPRCEAYDTYIISGESGEFAVCAHAAIGPVFIAPDELIERSSPPKPPERGYWYDRGVDCSGHFTAEMYRQMYGVAEAAS